MNKELQARIDFLERELGIKIDPGRVQKWMDELEEGGGRDLAALWSDILTHVVGGNREAVEVWVSEAFQGEEISAERMKRLVDELVSGQRSFNEMKQDIEKATGKTGSRTGAADDPDDIQIMGGPKKWYKTRDGDWYVAYQAPGNQWIYFEVSEEELDAIFGEGMRPGQVTNINSEANLARQKEFHYGGTVAEVTGDDNFLKEANKALERALADGALPDWLDVAGTQEILGLVYVAQEQEKGADWLINEIAKTKAFKTRYAGVEHFREQGLSWAESVSAYRQFETQINQMHKRRGDNIQIKPTQVKKYLEAGHSADDVKFVYDSFDHLEANKGAFKEFNAVLRARGDKPMTRKDQMKFLRGQAPAELYQIWEEFSVFHAAREAGLRNYMSAAESVRLAQKTAGIETADSIAQGMQQAAALALRYRAQIDVTKYGLTADDIIEMSMGVKPRSGKTHAELTQIMQKISAEAEGFLRQQATPFIGFTPEGRPQAASLGGARQEGL